MALLTVDDLRAHVTSALTDDALQLLLDAAEQAITQVAGAPGEATQIIDGGTTWLFLRSPAAAITEIAEKVNTTITTLADDDYRLGSDLLSLRRLSDGTHPQTYWQGRVTIVSTPVDDIAFRSSVQIQLVRLFLDHHPGVQLETIGDWTEQFQSNSAWNYALERDSILSTLRAPTALFA